MIENLYLVNDMKEKADNHYTESQIKLLEMLAKYRFLTVPHMMTLGIQKNDKALSSRVILPLIRKTKPLIQRNDDVRTNPSQGKLHYIYSLTDDGAKVVAEYLRCDIKDIVYPQKKPSFQHDYFHRCDYIRFYIAIERFFNQEKSNFRIKEAYHYFDNKRIQVRINNQQYPATSLLYETIINNQVQQNKIEADGIFITDNFQEQNVFIAEVHRTPNTKDILEQINKHIEAMWFGAVLTRFNIKKNGYLLSVSTEKTTLDNLLQRVKTLPAIARFQKFIFFSSLDKIEQDFANAWVDFNGVKINNFLV